MIKKRRLRTSDFWGSPVTTSIYTGLDVCLFLPVWSPDAVINLPLSYLQPALLLLCRRRCRRRSPQPTATAAACHGRCRLATVLLMTLIWPHPLCHHCCAVSGYSCCFLIVCSAVPRRYFRCNYCCFPLFICRFFCHYFRCSVLLRCS